MSYVGYSEIRKLFFARLEPKQVLLLCNAHLLILRFVGKNRNV